MQQQTGRLAAMEKNVGSGDRLVRIILGIALIAVVFTDYLGPVADIIAALMGLYLLGTALMSKCFIYKAAGIDTTVKEAPYSTTDDRAGL
jgi:hypothetical protein